MASINDVSQAITSALDEIGVTGELKVKMDGNQAEAPIGPQGRGDEREVSVDVTDLTKSHETRIP